jgi:cardiolipin synthase (CMP-forming)
MRLSRTGIAGSLTMLVVMGGWLGLARPRGWTLALSWLVIVALVGMWFPGLANQISLLRAYLAAPALLYALPPPQLAPLAALVALAGASDLLDGLVARWLERPSRLGGALDPVVDGLFFGVTAVGLGVSGAFPSWLAAVVVLRFGLPALAGGLLMLAHRPLALRHTHMGQLSTLLIGIVLGGAALLSGLGMRATWLVNLAVVLVPLLTLGTWANLLWSNRRALRVSKR